LLKFQKIYFGFFYFQKSDVGYHAVGQISCLDSQGGLFVKWPDNTTSFCNPQELYLVGGDVGFTYLLYR
jgi:hypothetical protein